MQEKKELNVQIGRQVRQAREQARLTQEQLAERIDVSPQYVSDLERGVVGLSIQTLKRLCLALGVSSDQILFALSPENDLTALMEKCRGLSRGQFALLTEMIDCYLQAIALERLSQA